LGWSRIKYIKENSLKKKLPTLESWDKNFWASLQKSDIYIADHMSTTYAQALAINKPTLLYWDFKANELRTNSKPIFDKFIDLNILFDSPIKVAQMISSLDGSLANWWSNEERQSAINEFLALFCSAPTNGAAIWQNEFKRMLLDEN
jgi:putative transferase (TIGR04331 family)